MNFFKVSILLVIINQNVFFLINLIMFFNIAYIVFFSLKFLSINFNKIFINLLLCLCNYFRRIFHKFKYLLNFQQLGYSKIN